MSSAIVVTDDVEAGLALFDNSDIEGGVGKMPWFKYLSARAKDGVTSKTNPAGVVKHSYYYEDAHGVTAIRPFTLHAMKLFRFNGRINSGGKVVATRDKSYRCPETPRKFKQGVLVLALVYHPSGLQVAIGQFTSGLCDSFKGYEGLIGDWKNPEAMAKRGQKFADAGGAIHEAGRFTLTIGGYGKDVDSADGDETFEASIGTQLYAPSTPAQVEAFNEYMTRNTAILTDAVSYFAKIADGLMKLDETKFPKAA